jgi:hypothetical protein
MRADWIQRWKDAGVSERIIREFYSRYGQPEEGLTKLIEMDDGQAGIAGIKLGTSEAIRQHDFEHLLHKLGYAVTTNAQTQGNFLRSKLRSGVTHLYLAPRDIVFGIVGASVGGVIWLVRDLL